MREIKFRIWDKNNKKFISRWERLFINVWECCVYAKSELEKKDFSYNKDLSEIEVEQFTGFKDKHGTEIYEGDIIEISYKNSSIKQNAKVVYEKGCFFAELGDRFAYHLYEVEDNCEVIGNIHENSELLK